LACSKLFRDILREDLLGDGNLVVVIPDCSPQEMETAVDALYSGNGGSKESQLLLLLGIYDHDVLALYVLNSLSSD